MFNETTSRSRVARGFLCAASLRDCLPVSGLYNMCVSDCLFPGLSGRMFALCVELGGLVAWLGAWAGWPTW